ncbi:carboxylesterase/lipase family protein [Streptomyces sp. NPDC021098]|uniref:carboxylesterase/lipase family protein n=1 Tax=unclassified Streptomyces TaxID=2593676 RepID=UPI0037980134
MFRRVLAAVVSVAALITVPSAAPTVSRPLTVATDKGEVRGAAANGVRRFFGIPYAAPPVGDRRWQPPAPAARWPGVRAANQHGARCVQTATGSGPGTSEDCLYLDVYAPARRVHHPLPVLFWIHGGGFMSGSGDLYDGSLLARTNNVIVVTVNYRLGVFGFLDLPGLSARGGGNYGMLDQQAALRWTRRNIAAFGGDPGRVTVSGESAGGQSVCALLASPPARGLFDRAIIQSGGCPSLTAAQATARGRSYATAAGCGDPATGVSCLRAERPDELLAAGRDFGGILNGPLPVSGTPELPVAPGVAVRTGRFADVPLLIGSNRDEIRKWALPFAQATEEQYERVIGRQFGPHANEVLARYPYDAHGPSYNAAYALGAVWTDSSVFYGMGGCQYQRLAGRFASQQPKTYFYAFGDRDAPPGAGSPPPGFTVGASHAAELPYLWPSMAPKPLTPEQRQLSRTMVRYWGAFVRGHAAWPSYRGGKLMSLLPGGRNKVVGSAAYAAQHQCSLWNGIDYRWETIDPAYLARRAGVR